ncbi:hypothetical protein KUCAC02_037329, partial [Chaenocephalus aceratus]
LSRTLEESFSCAAQNLKHAHCERERRLISIVHCSALIPPRSARACSVCPCILTCMCDISTLWAPMLGVCVYMMLHADALRPLIGRRARVTPRTRRVTRWPPQRHFLCYLEVLHGVCSA